MFIANGSYDEVTLIIKNCKNNGTIQAAYVPSNVNDYFPNYFRAVTHDGKGGSLMNVTVDGVTYKGSDESADALNGSNVEQKLTGENGKFINGPMDATLALTRNADGTFTITPASAQGVARYEISIGMYATIKAGGSCREFIQEVINVTDAAHSYTSIIKDFAFVDQKWVREHNDAVRETLNGYTIYTLNGTSYYYLLDADSNTVNGNPRPLSLFGVTAYDSNGKIVAAAALTE